MLNYRLKTDRIEDGVIRISDNANIPPYPGNRDWQEFLDLGGRALPAPVILPRRSLPTVEDQLEALYLARKGDSAKLIEIDSKIEEFRRS